MNESKSQQELLIDRAVEIKKEADEIVRLYGNFQMLRRPLHATSDLVFLVERMAREICSLSVRIALLEKAGRDA